MKAEKQTRKTNSSLPCAVYGQPSTVVGCFVPDEGKQLLYGAPAGKIRHLFYGLCEQCAARGPAIIPEIEQRALAECVGHTWN